ncbi:hypothetical protein FQA39_LY12887 [Lamprigera yunnana]|nr:hypothetical protein FQA39_LY12887 [Lamprigera yunnana]
MILNQISLNIVEDIKQLTNLEDLKTYLINNTVKVKSNDMNFIRDLMANATKNISLDDFNYLVKTNITSMFEAKQEYMLTFSKEHLLDQYELLVSSNDIEVKIKAIEKIHYFFAVEKSNEMINNSQANISELQFTNNLSDLNGDVFELLGDQYKVIFELIELTYTTKLFLNVVKELIKELK